MINIIGDECFRGRGELQNIRPIETVGMTFRDRNVGDTLISNGDFASGVNDEWNEGSDLHVFDVVAFGTDYELQAKIDISAAGVPACLLYTSPSPRDRS